MYPFQRAVAARLAAAPRGAIVVVPPGQGKTLLSIAAADSFRGARVLVVCPASLTANWEREIDMWGTGATDWTITTWDKAARLAAFDGGKNGGGLGHPDIVILDESVLTKSRNTNRFRSFRKVRKYWGRVWLLSGNPTTRYADDLWAQLALIWPQAYPSYWRFARRYCVVEETPWGDKVVGTRTNRNAMEENDDLIVVVGQEDVVDLPEYRFDTVDVALRPKQQAAFSTMASSFVAELGDGTERVAQNEISKLVALQQITSWWDGESAKHDALFARLQEDGPHLVWTHWRAGAIALTDRLHRAGYRVGHVSGEMPTKLRDAWLTDFKSGLLNVLVLSIGVGKFGHTLTNARTIHYVDKTWNADDYFQSLRRVRRIGLEHRPLVITYRAPGTTDELVEMNLEGKLGGISRLTRSDLAELLRGLGRSN
jgi:SWI/SNF-related matrix-associated actin-dependent regulator 1 of chromatin subfamily A